MDPKIGRVRSRPGQLTTILVSVQTTLRNMLPNIKSSSKRKSPPDGIHSEAPQKRAAIPRTTTMSDNDTWKQVAEIAENALDNDDDTILMQVSAVMNDMGQVAMELLKTDVQYDSLIKGKEEAKTRQDHRFDILGCLPYDIACSIIDKYFSQDQLVQYSRICSTWRSLIINYPKV